MKKLFIFSILALTLKTTGALAWSSNPVDKDGVDSHSNKALKQTQDMLNDPAQRKKAANENSSTRAADEAVKAMTGGNSQLTSEVYSLAADVFSNVVKESKGNPVKMQEAMEKFKKDPEGFAKTWTPEQKEKLHKLEEAMKPSTTAK